MMQISYALGDAGRSQALSISSTSAQSNTINASSVVVTPTVDCFVRQGSNPTAVSDGTDLFLLSGASYRLSIPPGVKLAFITSSASGTAYITPGS